MADGVPARWLDAFKTPTITLPQPAAVRWFSHGVTECRIKIDSRVEPGQSTVVTGEIPGQTADVLLLCGHHDSTFNSTAPDDNLSGVAVALQVAAILTRRNLRPKRTVRFCSFGAEEQLSEGARWYAFESGKARRPLRTEQRFHRCPARHDARLRRRRRGIGRVVSRRGRPFGDAVQSGRGIKSL